MHFRHEMRYDAPVADVRAMLADPAFREKVCQAQDTLSHEVEILARGEGMKVRVDQVQPADAIPSFAKRIVGDRIEVLQREDWSGPRHATLDVSIPGKPGHLKGTVTLAEDGDGTLEVVEADVRVHIPVLGGKLERLISELLEAALRSEERVGRTWLAGER